VNVWPRYTDRIVGISFLYPSSLLLSSTSSTRPNAINSVSLSDATFQSTILITEYNNFSAMPVQNWFDQVLRGNEYSGSFNGGGDAVTSVQSTSCSGSPGLLVRGDVFGYQVTRLFCTAAKSIVEFESSAADGDESPDGIVLLLAGTFTTI
jgi:hypothetical protein